MTNARPRSLICALALTLLAAFAANGGAARADGTTMSPRLARGQCVGLLATVDTNQGPQGQQFTIRVVARSSVADALNAGAQDSGTVVNVYGKGARLSSPVNPALPPAKLVEGHE